MEKQRRVKILSIVALVLAISAMTLGFSAFSTTLNISSSATVTPNASDFKMMVYGLNDDVTEDDYNEYTLDSNLYTSTNSIRPILGGAWNGLSSPLSSTIGTISSTSNSIVISNMSVGFYKPTEQIIYPMIIYNEGKYDAYVTSEILGEKECTTTESTMTPLMEYACEQVNMVFELYTSDGDEIYNSENNNIVLKSGEYIYAHLYMEYSDSSNQLSDGSFNIKFPNIELSFSTTS
ncbi:MAG: hypothetical protein IJA30_06740 [Bacilli bacterium]|nr:hypothetical protein [Bacilli bacterium]